MFLNRHILGFPKNQIQITLKSLSLSSIGNLVDGLLDLGHTLVVEKLGDIKVEELAPSFTNKFLRREQFGVDAALESHILQKKQMSTINDISPCNNS